MKIGINGEKAIPVHYDRGYYQTRKHESGDVLFTLYIDKFDLLDKTPQEMTRLYVDIITYIQRRMV